MDLTSIDVVSNAVYLDDVPFEQFAVLRQLAPVHKQQVPDPDLVPEAWVVSSQEHIRTVSIDTETFSSQRAGIRLGRVRTAEGQKVQAGNFIMLDDPEHRRLRRMVSKGFTARVVRTFAEHFGEVAVQAVDKALAAERLEFVEQIAVQLPTLAICELLGMPPHAQAQVLEWSNAIVGLNDPDGGGSPASAGAAVVELGRYALELAEQRRAAPREDLLSKLATAEGEDRLSDEELVGFTLLLLVAGNESTRNTTSHAVIGLAQHPDQLHWLREDLPGRLDGAVEEMIRWASPLTYMARTATRDVELGGQVIREGDRIAMFYCSANRDEAVFADPDSFRLDRDDAHLHMSFGVGSHSCMGSSLARVELKAVFNALLQRVDQIEIDGPVTRLRSSWVRGVKQLPIRMRRI
ncbi:MAG: cytochrome P450 [Mycobacteriales bacterium]